MILFRFVSYKPTSVSLICSFHQNSCMDGTLAQDSTTQLQRGGSWKRVIMLVKFLWIYSFLGYNFTSQDASIINTQFNFKQTQKYASIITSPDLGQFYHPNVYLVPVCSQFHSDPQSRTTLHLFFCLYMFAFSGHFKPQNHRIDGLQHLTSLT